MTVNIIDQDSYKRYVRLSKKKPNNRLMNIINSLHLQQYGDDDNSKAIAFLRAIHKKRYKWNTFLSYYNEIRPLFFPKANISPKARIFDSQNPPQNRYINSEEVERMMLLIKASNDPVKWPIMLSYYTALRASEVVNLQISHLYKLTRKQTPIPLKRKTSSEWLVFYFEKFNNFIRDMSEDESIKSSLAAYIQYKVDAKLFAQNSETINYNLKKFYILSGGTLYSGFGLHIFRYHLATVVQNRELARLILDHKNRKTTDRYYVKIDNTILQNKLEVATRKDKFYQQILTEQVGGT